MPNDLLAWGLGMLVLVVVLAGFAGASRARKGPGLSDDGGGHAYSGSDCSPGDGGGGGGCDGGGGGN